MRPDAMYKLGYYPTQPQIHAAIQTFLSAGPDSRIRLLDPCAGISGAVPAEAEHEVSLEAMTTAETDGGATHKLALWTTRNELEGVIQRRDRKAERRQGLALRHRQLLGDQISVSDHVRCYGLAPLAAGFMARIGAGALLNPDRHSTTDSLPAAAE